MIQNSLHLFAVFSLYFSVSWGCLSSWYFTINLCKINSFHYGINDIPSKLQGQCQRKATIIANAEQFFYDQTQLPRCHSNTAISFLSTFALPCHCGSFARKRLSAMSFSVHMSLLCFLFKFNLKATLFSRNGLRFTLVTLHSRNPWPLSLLKHDYKD